MGQFGEELTRRGLHMGLGNSCFFIKRTWVRSWPHPLSILSGPRLDVVPFCDHGGASVKTKDQHHTSDELDRYKDLGYD